MLSVGYVLFGYASIPRTVIKQFDVGLVSVGLLMSAVLLAFMLVQVPGSKLVDRVSTARLLFAATAIQAVVAIFIDVAPSFGILLVLRGVWGLAGGLIMTAGATHFARLYTGPTATRHQGVYGGMVTLGGAFSFLLTPAIVAKTGWFGVHAVGALLALPGIALFVHGLRDSATAQLLAPSRQTDGGATSEQATVPESRKEETTTGGIPSRIVLVAGVCYMATLSGYITLSTFITAYFADLGIVGPLNAAVLLVATVGRTGGGLAAGEWSADNVRMIALTTSITAVGFVAMTVLSGISLFVLPFVTMIAVSGPFGAIFNVAADTSPTEGRALSVVVAMGNFASLILPALTGMVREATGGYDGAFLLLAGLNGIAALAILRVTRVEK